MKEEPEAKSWEFSEGDLSLIWRASLILREKSELAVSIMEKFL